MNLHSVSRRWRDHQIAPLFIIFFFSFFALVFSPQVLASAKSDYDYQYGRYRLNYPEFSLLRADYLSTPSLDNQQKAILSAKQTIVSRDLAKASFAWYLMDLISSTRANYLPIQPIFSALSSSREFFLAEAQKSQSIVTQDDLKKFTQAYLKSVVHHDRIIKYGIIANKLATLVRIQMDSKSALESLMSKLPASLPATLTARIQELSDSSLVIDGKIELVAKNLNIIEAEEEADAEIFFSSRVERLMEIRTLQLDWINKLIDIEKNYAQLN